MALKNIRLGTDQRFALSLSNAGNKINMNDVEVLHLCMYSNDQRSNDGSIGYAVNADDATALDLLWLAKSQSYLGSHSVHGTIRYAGAVASFDVPAVNVVSLTSEADISTEPIVLEASVGAEGLTATITIQGIGPQGPKGPKGDKMTYADLTQEDKKDLYEGVSEVMKPLLATKQDALTDTDGSYGQRVAELEKGGIASQEKLSELHAGVTNLRKYTEDGFGGVIQGFDIFSAENIFTIKGKARNKDTGEEYNYAKSNVSPLINLEYLRNSSGDIELIEGTFRGSSLGVAFFFDANGEYIGYDGSTTTYSDVTAFPSSLIPINAVYVSFLQFNNQSSVTFYTYNKPISKYNDLKIRMGITGDYPIVVTPNMTPKAFYEAIDAQMSDFASNNKTYKESFFYVQSVDFAYTWENVLSIVSKNLRQDIGDVNTPMNIVCDNVNKALTERIYRFYDAKPLSNAERDASLTTGLNKGEPSVIISDDGGTMHIYGNGKRISTTDGVKWTEPIDIVKSDSGRTLHESINYIDGVYYLIAPRQNSGGNLELYTSTDGINFEYKGKLFLESTILDGTNPVVSWGNPYLIRNYGDGKFYLYIETQESGFSWRIHLIIFDDFTTENADGTIGARTIYENNPIIQRPFGEISRNAQSAGNPDFFKIGDNRPIKVDNKYFMMFHSTHVRVAHLFRASSYDLIHWNIDGIMWDNRDKPSGGDETSGNADACVIEFKGRTYLFYTHDINQVDKGIAHIKYTIDDRPLSELLKLYP